MTPQQIEALKLALDALIWTTGSGDFGEGGYAHEGAKKCLFPAIATIKEALAEHAMREVQRLGQEIEQEPVCPDCKAKVLYECVACSCNNYPPQRLWVGLTDEEIETIADKVANENFVGVVPNFRVRFARSIEQALKERNQ